MGALVAAAERGGWDWASAGGRFAVGGSPADRLRHPAMLATLVYRFGPPGPRRAPPVGRLQANGQCTITRRAALAAAGGYRPAAGHLTDDVALARSLAARGWRVGFLDGTRLFDVELPTRAWARSLALRDVTPWPALVGDVAVVWLAQALPLPRLLLRRGDALDAVLLLARLGLVAGTAPAYARAGASHWLSPLADVPVALGLTGARCAPGPDVAGLARTAREGEAQPDQAHERTGGRRAVGRVEEHLRHREAEDADPGPPGERRGGRDGGARGGRHTGGPRRQHDHPADEGEDRPAATEAGEGGPGVAHHGRPRGAVAHPPGAGRERAPARGRRPAPPSARHRRTRAAPPAARAAP